MPLDTLTIVVDCQNDFVREHSTTVENIANLIKEARGPLYFTMDTHFRENYFETREGHAFPPHCIIDTDGHDIPPLIKAALEMRDHFGYMKPIKFYKSTFGCQRLTETVKREAPRSIVICGFCTDICVISNALALRSALPDTPITVYSNCCAGTSPTLHEAALNVMKSNLIEVKEYLV